MTTIEVFDPAMCCSTGVCGPQVDPDLARFAADLRVVRRAGAQVTRHTLSQEPVAFVESDVVRGIIQAGGEDALPVVLVDGRLKWAGHYPTTAELTALTALTAIPAPVPVPVPSGYADSNPTADDAAGCRTADDADTGCCAPAPTTGLQLTSAPGTGGCC